MIPDKQEDFNGFFSSALLLFLINIFSENIASFSPQLNAFIGTTAFLVYLFLTAAPSATHLNYENIFILCICFAAVFLFFNLERFHRLLLFSTCLLLLSRLQAASGQRQLDLYTSIVTSILCTATIFSYDNFCIAWYVVQGISKFISATASKVCAYTINYSATYTGVLIATSFFAQFVSNLLITKKWKIFNIFSFLLLMVIGQLGYVVLYSYLLTLPIFYFGLEGRAAVDLNIILFLFFLIPLFFFLKKIPITWKGHFLPAKCLIMFFFLIAATSIVKPLLKQENLPVYHDKKILFFNEGVVDWDTPRFGLYGGEKGGMFGALIQYLKLLCFDVVISSIDHDNLEKAKVLVMINLNRKLSEEEKGKIWNFVKEGGSLLIIGDHTGTEIIREPYNDLLSPVGIQFKFDSAISHIPKWTNSLQKMPHFINQHLIDENDVQIWIGASLAVTYPVRPVILGKKAYSDLGNYLSPQTGYLGDMRYTHGERLGDIVLVAESAYGEGTVMVFGDSSPFQNSAISLSYLFIERVFTYLTENYAKTEQKIIFLSDIFLLLCTFMLAFGFNRYSVKIALSLCASSLLLVGAIYLKDDNNRKQCSPNPSLALIDASHLQRFSLDLWGEPEGFGGLLYNLFRNGYFPIVIRNFKANWLERSNLFILIAPAKPYSNSEMCSLKAFVTRGGKLMISAGFPEIKSLEILLKPLKLSVENMPLGRISPSQNSQGIHLHNAWPVLFDKNAAFPLCTVWDKSVIVYSNYHTGGVLFIADSEFFLNKNLEGMHNHVETNILALRDFFDHYLKN